MKGIKKAASGARIKRMGRAGGKGIGGGANKRGGALIATPAKDCMVMKKG